MAGGMRVKCKKCGDEIRSMHRHDFVRCKCGAIFIDGGSDYTRLGYPKGEPKDHIAYILGPDISGGENDET